MANGPFSSLSRRERFQAYLTMVLIIAAFLIFTLIVGIIIYNKIQLSEANSTPRQGPGVSTAPLRNVNDLNPPTIWGTQTNTNTTTPLLQPAASETNAN